MRFQRPPLGNTPIGEWLHRTEAKHQEFVTLLIDRALTEKKVVVECASDVAAERLMREIEQRLRHLGITLPTEKLEVRRPADRARLKGLSAPYVHIDYDFETAMRDAFKR